MQRGEAKPGRAKKPSKALPPPLLPGDVDLSGIPYLLLPRQVAQGELAAMSTGDEFKCWYLLHDASFDQRPGGSLPDDDKALAYLSRAGSSWLKVKAMALHGWVRCSDGRLHHPEVAKSALHAWIGRLRQRKLAAAGNEKQHGIAYDADGIDAQIAAAFSALGAIDPNSREVAKYRRASKRAPKPANEGDAPAAGTVVALGAGR